jgi:16S rRNA (adenine1518-N6/adenine1519-N6)-dimethyltransferase
LEQYKLQTKQQVQCLLASAGTSPNKKLGQNFLIDLNLMRKLIAAAEICRDDVVLEVGCGMGSFTEGLVEEAGFVVGVEYDRKLAPVVKNQVKDATNVRIINADILENKNTLCLEAVEAVKEAREKFSGKLMLVANLPYSVAASIMANLITSDQLVADRMYVTVQKEVAERMAAGPGTKRYGILSIIMEAMGSADILHILPPSVFWPAPKVDSAMVRFIRDEEKCQRIKNGVVFKEVVHLFMGHRRKMLKATTKLAQGELGEIDNWLEIFEKCGIDPTVRPEKLSAEEYIAVANLCAICLNEK